MAVADGLNRPALGLKLIAFLALWLLAPSPVFAAKTVEDEVMELVNRERWNNGQLPPLKRNSQLDAAAEGHSTSMGQRNFFSHCDLDTRSSPWERMVAAGYLWHGAGENIAAGYGSAAAVMNGWMNSSGHRSNILSTTTRELGIGYFFDAGDAANVRYDVGGCQPSAPSFGPYFNYWTQSFGVISNVYPVVINREQYETSSRSVSLFVYGQGWAQEMRFRNESGSGSAWQPFAANLAWTLSAGGGVKTVEAEIRSGATTLRASDTIVLLDSSDMIFADGFESGGVAAWSANQTDGGDLRVTPPAALIDARGLEAVVDDLNPIWVEDRSPNAESRYRARFYVDPNSLAMLEQSRFTLFQGRAASDRRLMNLLFRRHAGAYSILIKVQRDDATWAKTAWLGVNDRPTAVELDWVKASAPGMNDGWLQVWIDGALVSTVSGIDNDVERLDAVRWGLVAGIDPGTWGVLYLDGFESHHSGYIGP